MVYQSSNYINLVQIMFPAHWVQGKAHNILHKKVKETGTLTTPN